MTPGASAGAAPPAAAEWSVSPERLRDAVEALLAGGGALDALLVAGDGDRPEVRYAGTSPDGDVLIRCPAPHGRVPSVVDLLPRLEWDEREARDRFGVAFDGHEPHRPLVEHPADLGAWTTPTVGEDVHQVAVGPIHAGVIESGHFRFHAVGERILHVDVRLFHKHRGLERSAEGMPAADALAVVQRACGACAVANAVAYAHAVEQAAGMWPSDGLRRARTLLLELERLYNHLNDLGAVCAGVGLAAGAMAFAALKERAQRVVHDLAGHRFLFGTVAVGRSAVEVGGAAAARARAALADVGRDAACAWRELEHDASLRDRVRGAGHLPAEEAGRLGTVGPAARASGVPEDVRAASPRLAYPGFRAAAPSDPTGDVAARMEVRAAELADSLAMVDELLTAPVAPAGTAPGGPPAGRGAGRVESPRGRTVCAVELAGGTVRRVHLRTGSYANWPSVARAARGAILPDFPLINKSFELCYACVDR